MRRRLASSERGECCPCSLESVCAPPLAWKRCPPRVPRRGPLPLQLFLRETFPQVARLVKRLCNPVHRCTCPPGLPREGPLPLLLPLPALCVERLNRASSLRTMRWTGLAPWERCPPRVPGRSLLPAFCRKRLSRASSLCQASLPLQLLLPLLPPLFLMEILQHLFRVWGFRQRQCWENA